jgi:hypothetical protein
VTRNSAASSRQTCVAAGEPKPLVIALTLAAVRDNYSSAL